jgi:hypothetical protein
MLASWATLTTGHGRRLALESFQLFNKDEPKATNSTQKDEYTPSPHDQVESIL